MNSKNHLSKSRIMSARQCPKLLYLDSNHPELANISSSTEAAFAIGHAVGDIAQQIYGNDDAVLIQYEDGLGSALSQTEKLMKAGPSVPIFEATFQYDNVLVRNNWGRSKIYNFVFGIRPRFRKDCGSPVSSLN